MLASLVLFVAIGPAAAQDPDEFAVESTPAVAPAPAATGSFAWPVGAVPNPVPAPPPPPKPVPTWPTGVVSSGSAREVAPVAAAVAAPVAEPAPAPDAPMW